MYKKPEKDKLRARTLLSLSNSSVSNKSSTISSTRFASAVRNGHKSIWKNVPAFGVSIDFDNRKTENSNLSGLKS